MSNSLWPHGIYSPCNSPGQNTGVGNLSLLQGIFPTQGSNSVLLHCRQILYQLSHKGSPRILEWVAYSFSRGSSQPQNQTGVSCIAGGFFTNWAIREALKMREGWAMNPELQGNSSGGAGDWVKSQVLGNLQGQLNAPRERWSWQRRWMDFCRNYLNPWAPAPPSLIKEEWEVWSQVPFRILTWRRAPGPKDYDGSQGIHTSLLRVHLCPTLWGQMKWVVLEAWSALTLGRARGLWEEESGPEALEKSSRRWLGWPMVAD